MNTKAKTFFVVGGLVMLVILASMSMWAQGVTTAAMNGKVTDKAGQGLPGANVVATHTPSGTIYGTSTREDGSYSLPNLRVGGPYSLSVSYVGHKKQELSDISLQLSQNAKFDFQLVEEAVQAAEVVVRAERNNIMSSSRTGAATNVVRAQIDRLPTISRSFQDYLKLSPYFNGANSSAAGRNNKYNNIQIDGASFNDAFGLGGTGTPGGQASIPVTPISLDAIEEFQIVVSPFDVRQSGFTGAGINAITRSGTNSLRGSAFYNTRNQDFAGVSPDALEAKLASFSEKSYGFRLGGPIIENQLFFFANAEIVRRDAPFTRNFNQTTFGTNAYTAYVDSLNILSNFLRNTYGYETGSWGSGAPVPQFDNSDKFFARLDFNLSESHKLTARWNYLNSVNDNSPSRFRGTADVYSENSRYKLLNKTHSLALQLTSLFGNSASNELIIGYNDQFDNPTFYGQPFPTLEVRTRSVAPAVTTDNRLAIGSEEFRHRNELGQNILEITDNFSWYLPEHTVTFGTKLDFIKFRNLFIADNFGFYQYNSVAAFLAGGAPAVYANRYSATSNPLQEANWGYQQYGFYVQDEWTVSPTLKIVGGLRVDIPMYTDKPNYNARFDSTFTANGYSLSTDKLPKSSLAISPRIGFNWAVDEDRNTQVRGGVGIFYGRFPAVWVSNQYSNTGVDYFTMTQATAGAPTTFNPNPFGQPKTATGLPTAEVNVTDPDFKAPSIMRFNFAVDQRLTSDIVATVEGIFSKSQNEVYYQNINLAGVKTNGGLTPNGKLVGEGREVWALLSATTGLYLSATANANQRQINPNFTAVYLVKNTDQGSNANIIGQIQRQDNGDGFYASIGYTWGMARDVGGTNSTTASSGWRFNPSRGNPNDPMLSYADGDRRHRVFATVSYRYDWGMDGLATTIGAFYNGLSGRPYSYMVTGDVNGDGLSDNDIAYIPRDRNDVVLLYAGGGAAAQSAYDSLFAFIDSDPYLSVHKGEFAERNGARSPWSHQLDLRISQEIPSFMGHKLEVTFDFLNLINLFDKTAGWVRLANDTPLLTFVNVATPTTDAANAGKPRYRFAGLTDPSIASGSLSRWSAQFGVRYTF